MKNKRLTYVLLPVAVLVWGAIFYKVWSAMQPVDESLVRTAHPVRIRKAASVADLPARLSLHYPDPFLSATSRPTSAIVPENSLAATTPSPRSEYPATQPALSIGPPVAPAPVQPPISWPDLGYTGSIENRQKQTHVAMVTINGKQFILKEHGEQQGVVIERIYADSVAVSYKGHRRTLSLHPAG